VSRKNQTKGNEREAVTEKKEINRAGGARGCRKQNGSKEKRGWGEKGKKPIRIVGPGGGGTQI